MSKTRAHPENPLISLLRSSWFLKVLIAVPALILGVYIVLQSVNTPFWDQWELVPIIEHVRSGHFLFHDFWVQHNEHRLFFPQLLMMGAAYLTHWNTRVECIIGFLIAVSSFLLLFKTLHITARLEKWSRPAMLLLALLLSLLWFSPVQVENWLWGWQIQWFMNVLGIMLVVLAIARVTNKKLSYAGLGLILGGGILAQYSLANGTLIWPIVVVALIYLRVAWQKVAAVAATGIVTTLLYYRHYANPSAASQKLTTHHPLLAAHYFFIYLGRPLTFVHRLTPLLGILLLLVFVALAVLLFVRDHKRFVAAVPWIALGLYAIGTAAVTTFARLGFGLLEAYSSRYTTMSSLLVVSSLALCFVAAPLLKAQLKNLYRPLAVIVLGGTIILILANWAWGIGSGNDHHRQQQATKQCTHVPSPTDACLLTTYPNAQVVAPRLSYLKQIHWGGY